MLNVNVRIKSTEHLQSLVCHFNPLSIITQSLEVFTHNIGNISIRGLPVPENETKCYLQ